MELIQIIVLALVQGFTEFLPISSSAHLILAPHLFGYSDQGLPFDLAVHLGTLLAVVIYFRRSMEKALPWRCRRRQRGSQGSIRTRRPVIWETGV